MRLLLTFICAGLIAWPTYAGMITEDVAKRNIPKEDLLKMGEALFNTEGTNTCVYCHGKGGHGGNQAGAADLRHPKTWRSYQALGGDAAFNSNKEKFLKDMEEALVFLIRNEATVWNLQFAKKYPEYQI